MTEMLSQFLQNISNLKLNRLQAQQRRIQAEIEEIDRQIQDCNEAIQQAKSQQQALFKDFN